MSFIGDSENAVIYFVDKILFPYLRSLKGTPEKEKIASIFNEISRNKMRSPYNFLDVVAKLDSIDPTDYEDTHILSQYYEELLQNMGSEAGWSGEYYTPRPIIRFITKIIKPKVGEKILDPFAGSGGFLIESYKQIKSELGDKLTKQENDILQKETFYGQEKKSLPYLIGTMNLILHGILTPNFYRKNTLEEDVHNVSDESKFDIILTNPPFGGKENKMVQNNFPYPIQATEALALQYVMRKLADNGRVGMVLPEGQVMFGGNKFKDIRRELLEKFNVFAIVSLPQGVFTSMGTGVKTNLLFFKKDGAPTKDIWYYELKGKFTKKQAIKDKDFEDALKKFKNREISENSWVTTIEEIKKRDYDLTAKNPNKKNETEYQDPRELLLEVEQINSEINNLINEIKGII
jgi:type I restriction enzyme M protein